MKIFADLHLHSKYSRATSKDLDISNMEKYAKVKGINLLGTGDFTHPLWFKELQENLIEDQSGILTTKSGFSFVLQTEISLVYSQGGKGRRIHLIVYAPDFETVKQINDFLLKHGRLDYDGRPIFNITCPDFVYNLKLINKKIHIIPAHVWTPWFGLFGSMSGFDSVEECFSQETKHIFALETGLSSDPPMNWRLSMLDNYSLVSNSDSHSFWPWRMGREVNVFELNEMTYDSLFRAIKTRDGFLFTVEVDPNYGKYHFDGHRDCHVRYSPQESKLHMGICPVCKKSLTIGVLNRVEELADRKEGFKPDKAVAFKSVIPLGEIIAKVCNAGVSSKKVWEIYSKLIKDEGNEFKVLFDSSFDILKKVTDEKIAKVIIDNREGKIKITPGYDGVYGEPQIGKEIDLIIKKSGPQKGLSDFL